MTVALAVSNDPPTPKRETVAQKVKRLQAEATEAANEHVRSLIDGLHANMIVAAEIAEGGSAYTPALRDAARRIANDIEVRVGVLEGLLVRARG